MLAPESPENEAARQAAVERYNILDTPAEADYDDITALMSYISGAPVSLITLLDHDRNWLKSRHGIDIEESPRELSFCGHAINSNSRITIVEDARQDIRFCDNPLVAEHSVIFYAGVPLRSNDGFKLGMLCLFDRKPRNLDEPTKTALLTLGKQVEILLDQRLQNALLHTIQEKLEKQNLRLTRFAHAIKHDLKSPLTGILPITELLIDSQNEKLDAVNVERLNTIKKSVLSISDYVDDLLS